MISAPGSTTLHGGSRCSSTSSPSSEGLLAQPPRRLRSRLLRSCLHRRPSLSLDSSRGAEPGAAASRGARARPPREIDWSVFFGAKALAWAGGAVMLLGIVFFFVLAVNRGWIGPVARVTLGCGRLRPGLRRRPLRQAALRGALPLGARRCGDRDRRRLHDAARSQGPLRPRSRLGGHAPRGRHRCSGSRNGACLVVRAHRGPWSRRRVAGSRRPRSRHRGADGCGHRLCSSRVRGNGDRRDPAAVAAAARRRRRRHAAAGRRLARSGSSRRSGTSSLRPRSSGCSTSARRPAGRTGWARLRSPRCPHRCSC